MDSAVLINDDDVQRFLTKLGNIDVQPTKSNLLNNLVKMMLREVKSEGGPTPHDTSQLRGSIKSEITSPDSARVYTDLEYGIYQEFGTGIYGPKGTPITPKTKPYLAFFSKKTGRWVRAKSVKGVQAKRFMQKSFDKVKATCGSTIAEAVSQIVDIIKS